MYQQLHVQIYSVFNNINKCFYRNKAGNNIDITDILYQQQPQYNRNNIVKYLLQFVEYLFEYMKKDLLLSMRNILYMEHWSTIFIIIGKRNINLSKEQYSELFIAIFDAIFLVA